jgi:alkylhydroperoxidase family enzyme
VAESVTETEGGLDKVAEVLTWRESKLFSEAERVALEYAEAITYTDR